MAQDLWSPTAYARGRDVEIAYDRFGPGGGVPLLLVMGLAVSRCWWSDGLCQAFADEGFDVVRYDQRDTGASTRFRPGERSGSFTALLGTGTVPYTSEDVVDDAAAVLDVLAPSPHELFVQQPRGDLLRPIATALTQDPADPRGLADWAALLDVSPRTITRAFRAETGLSFARWQAVVRAQRAVLLLAQGVGVEAVAEQVGYRSASAFGVAFRRTTGLTPGRFRPA